MTDRSERLPVRHGVTFMSGREVFSVVGTCACGWSAKGQGMQGDRVYWLAREHFAEVAPPPKPVPPQLDTAF
jgi:hypothetical protein